MIFIIKSWLNSWRILWRNHWWIPTQPNCFAATSGQAYDSLSGQVNQGEERNFHFSSMWICSIYLCADSLVGLRPKSKNKNKLFFFFVHWKRIIETTRWKQTHNFSNQVLLSQILIWNYYDHFNMLYTYNQSLDNSTH